METSSGKRYTVAGRAEIDRRTREKLEQRLGAKKKRRHGGARTHYESIESLLDGEQVVVGKSLKGRIVA